MTRAILPESQIHPAVREKVANNRREIVDEVLAAVKAHDVLIVGMAINPFPRRAKKALDEANIAYEYIEFGSYLKDWRRRTALKMWTGWPTFPMIFVKGTFVGGAEDLEKLIENQELSALLSGE